MSNFAFIKADFPNLFADAVEVEQLTFVSFFVALWGWMWGQLKPPLPILFRRAICVPTR
jgi:hypothetical protein